MDYKYLNMETYKRKNHFEYFNSLAYPYVGLTVNVYITDLMKTIKAKKLPFFLSICYCVSRSVNRVPEFRQRILNNQIVEYDYCLTSHTVAISDGTYCYCDLDSNRSFEDYIYYAVNEQEKAKQKKKQTDFFACLCYNGRAEKSKEDSERCRKLLEVSGCFCVWLKAHTL